MKLANHIFLITLIISFVVTPVAQAAARPGHPALDFSKATLPKEDTHESEETPSLIRELLPYVIGTVAVAVTTGTIFWFRMARNARANVEQQGHPLGRVAGAAGAVGGAAAALLRGAHNYQPGTSATTWAQEASTASLREKSSWDENDYSSEEEEEPARPLSREEVANIRAKPIQQVAVTGSKQRKKLDMSQFADVAAARSSAKSEGVKIDMSAFNNMAPPPAIPVFAAVAEGDEPPNATPVDEAQNEEPPVVEFEGPPAPPPPPPLKGPKWIDATTHAQKVEPAPAPAQAKVAMGQGAVAVVTVETLKAVKLVRNGYRPPALKNAQNTPPQNDWQALLRAKFAQRRKATVGLTPEERQWQAALRRATLVEVGDDNPDVDAPSFTLSLMRLACKVSDQFDHVLANTLSPGLRLGKFQRYTLLLGLLKGFLVRKVPVEAADETGFLKAIEEIFEEDPRLFEKYGDLLKQFD